MSALLYAFWSPYIAIDVSGPDWPTDAHLHKIAQLMTETDLDFELSEADIYDFLARAALRFEPLTQVFADKAPQPRALADAPGCYLS